VINTSNIHTLWDCGFKSKYVKAFNIATPLLVELVIMDNEYSLFFNNNEYPLWHNKEMSNYISLKFTKKLKICHALSFYIIIIDLSSHKKSEQYFLLAFRFSWDLV
jgi:hypothetical protein